jgi:hypothetical protein
MRTTGFGLGLLALLLGAGCQRGGGGGGGISDSTFVAALTELQVIDRDATRDSAAKAAARREVLQERGLTPEGLERVARRLAADPVRAREIWRRIDSLATARTAVPVDTSY